MCQIGPRGQRFAYKGTEKKFNNSYRYIAEYLGSTNLFSGLSKGWHQKRNFSPTKYRPLSTGNGIFRTHRTSASVGVLALVMGVGT